MPFPSEDQTCVINHRGRPLVVVAGPGTGKTRTLVERMIALLREDQSREVTFITFTRTSRNYTETKLSEAFGEAVLNRPNLMFPRTSTLHTYAKRLVHRYFHLIGREALFSILIESKGERDIIIEELRIDLGLTIDAGQLSSAIAEVRQTGEWQPSFPVIKSMREDILVRFDELLRLYRTFDMEGIVLAACEILESPSSVLPEIFLQVDEYQDLNPTDQIFLNLLASHPTSQVTIVGDDAQSIYGFRHANYKGIRTLWNSKDWDKTRFQESHRLPSHILNAALDLMTNRGYLGTEINRKTDNGMRILVLQCTYPNLQIEAVARDIKARKAKVYEENRSALSFRDFLVLCPIKDQVTQTVSILRDRFELPVHTLSRPSIPDDYWSVILLLRIIENDDPLALRQWLPILRLTSQEIFILRDRALHERLSFSQSCYSSHDPRIDTFYAKIERIRIEAETPSSLIDALRHIDGVRLPPDFAALLESTLKEDGHLPQIRHILQLIYEHFGVFDPEEMIPEDDRILVATMHSAKGLEAAFVYCTWMNTTFMPMSNRDLEEERRVLYVALTRAKQDVVLTYPESYDRARHRRLGLEIISPFLSEIAHRLNIVRATASAVRSNPPLWHV